MNKEMLVELLKVNHPNAMVPEGAFERLLESEFFSASPSLLLPLASVSTLGFRVFEERDPEHILIKKYDNFFGNLNSRDAVNYRGRGIFHHSFVGRLDYQMCGKAIGIDLEANPSLASSDWDVMVKIADWKLENLLIINKYGNSQRIGNELGLKDVSCVKTKNKRGDAGKTSLFGYWIWLWLQKC